MFARYDYNKAGYKTCVKKFNVFRIGSVQFRDSIVTHESFGRPSSDTEIARKSIRTKLSRRSNENERSEIGLWPTTLRRYERSVIPNGAYVTTTEYETEIVRITTVG